MNKITFDRHGCKLGIFLNTPTQRHGDDRVPAKVIAIKNLMLSKEELNALFDDGHAWDMLYNERKGKPAEPFWGDKLKLTFCGKFKDSTISLVFGLSEYSVTFEQATVKTLKLEPTTGGLTSLSFTVVCLKSNVSGELARLDEHLDMSASVSVELGEPQSEDEEEENQEELDLEHQAKANGGTRVKRSKVDTATRRAKKKTPQLDKDQYADGTRKPASNATVN
jgi:hypothetical protein